MDRVNAKLPADRHGGSPSFAFGRSTSDGLTAARNATKHFEADSRARGRLENICDFYEHLLAELPTSIERWKTSHG